MAALHRVGSTTVHDFGRPNEVKPAPLASLAGAGPMPLRVFHTLRYRATDPESTDESGPPRASRIVLSLGLGTPEAPSIPISLRLTST